MRKIFLKIFYIDINEIRKLGMEYELDMNINRSYVWSKTNF